MRVDEVYFFSIDSGRLDRVWGLEDTWTRKRQLFGQTHDPDPTSGAATHTATRRLAT
jgi:hypothetical protein